MPSYIPKEAGNIVARHSLLGWIVLGAVPGNKAEANRVTAKPCQCEPDRLSQVEREEAR